MKISITNMADYGAYKKLSNRWCKCKNFTLCEFYNIKASFSSCTYRQCATNSEHAVHIIVCLSTHIYVHCGVPWYRQPSHSKIVFWKIWFNQWRKDAGNNSEYTEAYFPIVLPFYLSKESKQWERILTFSLTSVICFPLTFLTVSFLSKVSGTSFW